jgi:Rieske Fe-S protein
MAGCSAGAEMLLVSASSEGIIRFNVSGKLKNTGEGKLLEVDNTGLRIMLIKTDANSFTALDPVCTHKGCELIKRKNFLECPCHGSEFDLAGKVLKGPAEIPLGGYRTEFDGKNTVTIFLK